MLGFTSTYSIILMPNKKIGHEYIYLLLGYKYNQYFSFFCLFMYHGGMVHVVSF